MWCQRRGKRVDEHQNIVPQKSPMNVSFVMRNTNMTLPILWLSLSGLSRSPIGRLRDPLRSNVVEVRALRPSCTRNRSASVTASMPEADTLTKEDKSTEVWVVCACDHDRIMNNLLPWRLRPTSLDAGKARSAEP